MFAQLLGPEIETFIKERNFAALKECFSDWSPADLAELIADLPAEDQVIVFRLLPQAVASSTFEYLDREHQTHLLESMGREEVVAILNDMSPDDRTALLEELPPSAVTGLLQLLKPDQLAIAKNLLGYPEKSVGRLMTPDFIAVRDEWTVKQVLDYVREFGFDKETLNVIYVVDDQGRLIDDVRIREFLLTPLDRKVKDIRDSTFVALKVTDLERDVVHLFRKYDRTALPVVDTEGRLVGIVTIDDVLDVAEKEATDDMQKMGGSEALDEPYTTIPFLRMVKKRGSWLVILFLGEMLTATAMGSFQDEIEKAVVLALFVPLIISSGGNSGSQASTLIIRAMALGEITLRSWWQVMRREVFAGLALGSILGVIGFLRIGVWSMFSNIYGPHWLLVALTVSLSLIGVVLWGTLSGSMLPFLLRRCKIDPATSSAPFVATLVDVTGLVIYFSVAMLILRGSLLAPSSKDVVRLGTEKTTRAVQQLANLGTDWEPAAVDFYVKENRVVMRIDANEEFARNKRCQKCGGPITGKDHNALQHWPYLKIFDKETEIVSELPVLKCEKCGEIYEVKPPWVATQAP